MSEPVWRDATILLAAVDSVLCDDMSIEQAVAFATRWVGAVDTDETWKDGRHCGDCTKQPHSCIRCQVDEYEAEAKRRYDT